MLDRRDAVAAMLGARGSALLVTGLGSPTWDVAAVADSPHNFYLWGAMGGAAMARAAGCPAAVTVASEQELRTSLSTLYGDAGPVLLVVKVLANQPPLRVPLRDGTHIKNRFREALLGPKAFE